MPTRVECSPVYLFLSTDSHTNECNLNRFQIYFERTIQPEIEWNRDTWIHFISRVYSISHTFHFYRLDANTNGGQTNHNWLGSHVRIDSLTIQTQR